MFNNNAFGTITAIVAGLMALMVNILGCSEATNTCSASWVPPSLAGYIVVGFTGVALVAKAMRPGGWIAGLFNKSAVIVPPDKAEPGVVTPAQVAAPK